jgi:hypothetical protein
MKENFDELYRAKSELAQTRIHLTHSERQIFEKTQELERIRDLLNKQDGELKRTIGELNTVNTAHEVLKATFAQKEKKVIRKKAVTRLQAILTSMLFLLSSVLASFGVNLLTSSKPDQVGWILIGGAILIYFIAALITWIVTTEGSD